jgi:LmbE family N-acetylglucosaminyl deacetylase
MGAIRHQEALAAAAVLGVHAQDLRFLGYPDYGTLDIWRAHWSAQSPARGRLTRARAVPYSNAFRPGAPYKGEAILADLETILKDFRPTQIFVSHPADHHPDHAALYLFTRVALWDVQADVTAAIHPYLVHYPGWPPVKGLREQDALAPPPGLLAGFRWQSRELPPDDVAVKRKALAEHRTQFGYSASRLLPFVRPNELFGDLIVPTLAAGAGAVDLQGLTVRRVGDQLEIEMQLRQPLSEASAVSLSVCGYRQDAAFATMPKLEIQVWQRAWKVSDQGVALPRSAASGNVQDRKLTARIPLASLKDPSRIFLQVRTGSRRSALGQTPWWIVETSRP